MSGVAVLAGCLATDVWAQEDSTTEEMVMAPVVMTASCTRKLERKILSATTVISSQAIRDRRLGFVSESKTSGLWYVSVQNTGDWIDGRHDLAGLLAGQSGYALQDFTGGVRLRTD